MKRTLLKSKIHRATVTDANLNYEGSITIDSNLMDLANIVQYEKVCVLNINTGARFETYAIPGHQNMGTICLNGAAARLVQKNDLVIILTYVEVDDDPDILNGWAPTVVYVDDRNIPKS